jgi:hypothetical protein
MKLEFGLQEGLDHEAIKVRGKQIIGALREQEAGFRPPRCRFRIVSVIDTSPRECLAAVADTSISGRRVAARA